LEDLSEVNFGVELVIFVAAMAGGVREKRPILFSIFFLLLTVAIGILFRYHLPHIPYFFIKYIGSAAWAAEIYWLLTTLFPRLRLAKAALLSFALAVAVECFKLYNSPIVDAFRSTLAGKLILGRYFAFADIAAYAVAILLAALLDSKLRSHRPHSASS
jgi:hypothetical protein